MEQTPLFARKIHAVLARGLTKRRDFFDIGFYMSKWKGLEPNLPFLNNALQQSHEKAGKLTPSTWRPALRSAMEQADWKKVTRDVDRFLERPSDKTLFTRKNILNLL